VNNKQVKRALISVTDKTGLVDFARQLASMNVELISTGGTARTLRDAGLSVRDVSDLTGFPEMLDGRVKTLHPKVHGGILHIRDRVEHLAAVADAGIEPIDMVVVNLYAFEETARKPGVPFGELVENIDIGGPSMLRSAAKNFEDVAVVTATADYQALAAEMLANQGALSFETRWRLARQAFTVTAAYDSAIATTFNKIAADSLRLAARPSLQPCSLPIPKRQISATAKIRTRVRRSTEMAPAPGLPARSSYRGKNLATTTWSIWTPPGSWYRSLSSRR
jgi:phosphoribosylaminoimidazolecarboxamide formyltransferase / IMP cyclohydrolase